MWVIPKIRRNASLSTAKNIKDLQAKLLIGKYYTKKSTLISARI